MRRSLSINESPRITCMQLRPCIWNMASRSTGRTITYCVVDLVDDVASCKCTQRLESIIPFCRQFISTWCEKEYCQGSPTARAHMILKRTGRFSANQISKIPFRRPKKCLSRSKGMRIIYADSYHSEQSLRPSTGPSHVNTKVFALGKADWRETLHGVDVLPHRRIS